MTLSKNWKRREDDPLASHHRFYCPNCGTRYATCMGMILEMFMMSQLFYARTDAKCWDADDTVAMIIEDHR